jgi:hypothetical protein
LNKFNGFKRKLYEVNDGSFDDIALELFRFQAVHNRVYAEFLGYLKSNPSEISRVEDIPFLPVSFFKRHAIQTESWNPEVIFTSSGTTGIAPSRHLVYDLSFYLEHSEKCFEHHFGPLTDFVFLALLPSYLEREGSSLIHMMDHFIKSSLSADSGFYLRNTESLLAKIQKLQNLNRKVVIWGVTFALLDLAEQFSIDLSRCIIVETGGMKGRRAEITREEFHQIMKTRLNATRIHSEYGMTELLSQAYSLEGSKFRNPPYMRMIGRDLSDPMHKGVKGDNAGINVIDLANWHSMSFIETEDQGRVYPDGTFEILGRIDNSDVRGCNLMI